MRHLISRFFSPHALLIMSKNAIRLIDMTKLTSHHGPCKLPGGRHHHLRSGGNAPWVLGALHLALGIWGGLEEAGSFPK